MYVEWPAAPALRDRLACLWFGTGDGGTGRVLPDACLDIIWIGGRLEVAGPDTGPVLVDNPVGAVITGARFRPGTAATMLGVPASALLDQRVPLDELWGPAATAALTERVAAAPSPWLAAAELERALLDRLPGASPLDPAAHGIVSALANRNRTGPDRAGAELSHIPAVVAEPHRPGLDRLGADLGYSERQLRRRALTAFGYGPKVLERILRFQRFLALADRDPIPDLATLALTAGYADQAHLTRESGRLAGLPPARLLAERTG
jgi:AraC-like DNA-binding protein